jgi:hypothetical protein
MTSLELIHELWNDHQYACPYLRHDEHGCFCASPAMPASGDPYTPAMFTRFSSGALPRRTTRSASFTRPAMCLETWRLQRVARWQNQGITAASRSGFSAP